MNVFLSSHVWRQDHNGYSHQAPGYVDNALVQKNDLVRISYPPDGNCLVHVFDRALRSRGLVNVITCGKQPQLQWLSADEARVHCSRGIGAWSFASNDEGRPDVVLACAGDVPTIETVAAAWLLRKHVSGIRIRLVNVVDMPTLMRADVHPDGMDDLSFTDLFPLDVPVIFAHHGYPFAIRSVIQGRERDDRFPCARLHQRRQHDDAVQHGGGEPDEPVRHRHGCPAPRREAAPGNRAGGGDVQQQTCGTQDFFAGEPRGPAGNRELALDR